MSDISDVCSELRRGPFRFPRDESFCLSTGKCRRTVVSRVTCVVIFSVERSVIGMLKVFRRLRDCRAGLWETIGRR